LTHARILPYFTINAVTGAAEVSPTTLRRARTIAELRERSGSLGTEEGKRRALSFRPRPTDVFVSTYPKSGTTWLQQIVHGLRTRGSMDFDEITAVVPWLEMAADLGMDAQAPQIAEPRAFKSHLAWGDIPKGARYICVVRDPKDVVVSSYHFHEGWRFEPGAISIDDFAREFFICRERKRSYWYHVASWWEQRNRSDVLILSYEDMKADLPTAVRHVARLIDRALDQELLETVVKQSSIEFMLAHGRKFDDHLLRARNAARSLPPGGKSSKVRSGRVGDHLRELSRKVRDEIDAIWRQEIEPRFGLPSYEALRAEIGELALRR
jgi:Sulfotransferase domain